MGGNRWRNIIPVILSYWHIVPSTCLSLEKWWMIYALSGGVLGFLHLLDWSLNWGHLKKTNKFEATSDACRPLIHTCFYSIYWCLLLTRVPAKTKDKFGGMMNGAILSSPRTSSPTFLWFIGFDDVSMRLQTWQQRLMWQKDPMKTEFDCLDADRDAKWPLLVFLWCVRMNNANQCLISSHPFFRVLNMCQTQNMNPSDMHAAASLSPAATLGYLRWGPQMCV